VAARSLSKVHLSPGNPREQPCVLTTNTGLIRTAEKGLPRNRPGTHDLLQERDLAQYKGTVKWFNNAKGYGFLGREDGPDVFVHYSSIKLEGYKTLKEGDEVEFDVIQGTKGPQADQVTRTKSI
jgi:CspA family cold shock protein